MTPREALENALLLYTGTQESLDAFVNAAINALGPNWTETIYQTLGDLPPDEKERLDHAFKYYAALTAWAEAQSYLAEETFSNKAEIQERLPILEHWLSFFEGQGDELIRELQRRLDDTAASSEKAAETAPAAQPETAPTTDGTEPAHTAETAVEVAADIPAEVAPPAEAAATETTDTLPPPEPFEIQKIKKQIALAQDLQAWIAARCIHLNKKNVYEYPFFGLMLDMMEETKNDITAVFEAPELAAFQEPDNPTGAYLKEVKEALDADLTVAYRYLESQPSDLIKQGLDALTVRKTLGALDTSDTKEVIGPAPDGFEPLMDPYEALDERAVQAEYSQIETKVLSKEDVGPDEAQTFSLKKTSQTPQNGVQRKLSFSFGAKKPKP